ncbi:MAG: GNAT family N-acetyltransferase [Neisseriaceae bacterium]|nr:GNAT family N-acetyltransferase [Neisseriaceae bacterium]
MMTSIHIRAAKTMDQEAIYELHQDSVRQLCGVDYSRAQIDSWLAGRQAVMYEPAIEAGRLWVAETDAGLLGFIEVDGHEVTKLFVAGRGASRGVGHALLQYALEVMRAQGVTVAYLEATLTAVPFYERQGFVAGAHGFFSHGQSPIRLEVVHMMKPLS